MNSTFAQWLARDPDPASRDELQALIDADDQAELTRRFASRLEFGTAGLRGVVGAGPGMMNRLVIRETSAGLGSYLLREVPNAATRGIIVAYDGRLDSRQFARDAACVFAALGITVYLTPDVAATPVAAFGVVQLGAAAGVVVTASHNPPQYNGYKVTGRTARRSYLRTIPALRQLLMLRRSKKFPGWTSTRPARPAG